jgi:hypothetical protein
MDGRKWQVADYYKAKGTPSGDEALDAEVIARLEAGLPSAIRCGPRTGASGDENESTAAQPGLPPRASEEA